MRFYGACTNMHLYTLLLTLNICWFQLMVNCLKLCKSVNIVSIIYSLHARTMILNLDPRVMTFCCLCVTMSYIGVLLLYVVFLTFELFNMRVFTLVVYMLKSICNCIMCVCQLIIKDFLLITMVTVLQNFRLTNCRLPRYWLTNVSRVIECRHGTGSLGRRVNGSFGSSFQSGSPGPRVIIMTQCVTRFLYK